MLGQAEIFIIYEVRVFRFNNTNDLLVMLIVSWYNGGGNTLRVNGILLESEEEVQVEVDTLIHVLTSR